MKSPPLEQRKKRGFVSTKTYQCVLLRDLVQKALNDGRLQFGEKPKSSMKMDLDPMQMEKEHYAEPIKTLIMESADGSNMDVDKGEQFSIIADSDFQEVYPQYEEGLINFLKRCKLNESKTMLCPCCSAVFDEEAVKELESSRRVNLGHGWGGG